MHSSMTRRHPRTLLEHNHPITRARPVAAPSPTCNVSITGNCAPTYSALNETGALWPCPTGNSSSATCGSGGCEQGTGENPLCMNLNAETPCCCAKAGCNAEPLFNWIVGVCKGPSCACGSSHAPSCAPQNQTGRCGSKCTGADVPCCFGADVSPLQEYYDEGTHAKVPGGGKTQG